MKIKQNVNPEGVEVALRTIAIVDGRTSKTGRLRDPVGAAARFAQILRPGYSHDDLRGLVRNLFNTNPTGFIPEDDVLASARAERRKRAEPRPDDATQAALKDMTVRERHDYANGAGLPARFKDPND